MEVILSSMEYFFLSKPFQAFLKMILFSHIMTLLREIFLKSFNLQQFEDFIFKAVFIVEQQKLVSM